MTITYQDDMVEITYADLRTKCTRGKLPALHLAMMEEFIHLREKNRELESSLKKSIDFIDEIARLASVDVVASLQGDRHGCARHLGRIHRCVSEFQS